MVDKSTKSTTLILGATLFGKHLGSLNWVATGISALGLMALVFGYGDRKQLHKELAESAANLVASIEGIPSSLLSEEKVARWAEDYARICGKAPPPLKTLTIICEHEQSVVDCSNKKINADGKEEELIKLPWLWRRCLSQLKS